MIDPVEQDLNRYLDAQDEATALSELQGQKVSEWLSNQAKCADALSEVLQGDLADDIAKIMVMKTESAQKLHDYFVDLVREKFEEWAPKAVEEDIERAKQDEAENQADGRDYDNGY